MNIAYVTAGTVGAGHLVRGLAIGRGLARAGFAGRYRMFGPPLPFAVLAELPAYQPVSIASDRALLDPALALASELGRALFAFRPDLLLVDLFWAPLYWILPQLRCEAWLLLRICPPHWLAGPPSMPFRPTLFRRTFAIEPGGFAPDAEPLPPIVVANPEECRPPGALAEALGLPPGEELTVVAHAGLPGEAAELATLAGPRFHTLSLFAEPRIFPAAEFLGGADRIVSGAGYNAVWEAKWLGYAGQTTWHTFPRRIDDQGRRVEVAAGFQMEENGADILGRWVTGL